MPTEETERLLTLAERDPARALQVSSGRLTRVEHGADFRALYAPHPTTDEYLVILNVSDPAPQSVIRALVRHHVEQHDRNRVHVIGAGFTPCAQCAVAAPPAPVPLAQRAHPMRRFAAYN